ncbi:serine/threonine-protein kinase [Neoroseomonas oryzicola]|uniref:Protein kinase n=3 Tax=Neoroseomonas oryzicola TaxID=535904 RepID=A0ABX1EHE1_9PROT|nr:serine/threonine-protein kinase [Neoroseomonas oryzicola]NKE17216.1 protein kinase [Neoroseomonas oryzicola]
MLPAELNQKYEVRGTLGAGAMGTVYDAVDRIIERRVAIKVVNRPNESDPEAVEAHARFRREAQAAGRLSHPNIVGVYDYGENATQAWIVMELVEGGSLKGRLDKNERFTVPEIVRIMGEVCAGLHYSHQRGVVHRDIKPGNIMLTPDGQVKIADFGIARLENSSMTQVGTLIGTPSYMAPEQFRGEPVDLRADIWASGVMLYQLLTGEKPFEGGFSAVMHKALHTEPPPPSTLSVTTPRAFDGVISRALAKRPDDRFRSAAEFADAIRAAASGNAPEPAMGGGLPGLPGLNEDATVVTARPVAGATASAGTQSRPATPAPAASGEKKGPPVALIAGGAGALVAAAGAAWFFLAGPGAGPDPAVLERQRLEQEAAARDAQARAQAAADQAQRDAAAREAAAREQAARDAQAREIAAREQAAREQAAREAAARDQAATEAQARQAQAARDQAAAEQAARDAAAREQAARNAAARDQAARERAAAEAQAREAAAREQAAREQAAREQAARDLAAREQAARDQAAREAAARQQQQQQQQQPQVAAARLDLRAAAQALATQTPCSLIAWSATDRTMSLAGVVRRGDETAIRQNLSSRGVPDDAAQLALTSFDGPYCAALDLFRPVLGPAGAAPTVQVVGRMPLQKGELLQFDVQMPDWPAHLYLAYFMKSGEVANLVPSTLYQASARVRLGEPTGSFTGWEVDEPFGTDLAVVIASDRPLFGNSRPLVESQEAYMSALAAALRNARASGTRVVVRPIVVETVARR